MDENNFEGVSAPFEETPLPAKENRLAGVLRLFIDVLETLILSVVLFVGINAITARVRVDGTSMEPTLHNGEFILVNKLSFKLGEPERGDVIVFYFPQVRVRYFTEAEARWEEAHGPALGADFLSHPSTAGPTSAQPRL